MPMKQIFIRGKRTSVERAKRIIRQVYGSNDFKAGYRRGEVHVYFPNHISVEIVEEIAKRLRLEITMLGTRAILDVK